MTPVATDVATVLGFAIGLLNLVLLCLRLSDQPANPSRVRLRCECTRG